MFRFEWEQKSCYQLKIDYILCVMFYMLCLYVQEQMALQVNSTTFFLKS